MRTIQRAAVLGKPIAHSLSPVLHEAAYQSLGLHDWAYGKIEVGEDDLPAFVNDLDDSWRGLSLTMPLKRTIQPFGTPSNQWARELAVANTVVFDWSGRQPRLALYNTDVYGIARAFHDAFGTVSRAFPEHATAVILGNGNTAVSAMAACIMLGVTTVTVAARHPDRNPQFAQLAAAHGLTVSVIPLEQAIEPLEHCDIAISTIPGRGADPIAQQLSATTTPLRGVLLDVVYDPRPSLLMQVWRAHGGLAIGGERMLLHQAVAQVLLMTGSAVGTDFDTLTNNLPQTATLEQAMWEALEKEL